MKLRQRIATGIEIGISLFVIYYFNLRIDWRVILFYLRGARK